ncbi:Gfo/Idh/MocA family oxidoreductase, partial [bacterium]|nr:Gfo/Idh/MocA family oxidoreductase [bacterium]
MALKKYALVGCGHRGLNMYCLPIVNQYSDVASLVGLCDINQHRMDYVNRQIAANVPTFKNFEEMLEDTRPDTVIVASKDSTHHEFIVRSLESGCDVVTEKPMTIDEKKCRHILDTERKTGKTVTVAFNYRYAPRNTKIKELLSENAIGKVLSIDFHWYLDTTHGANYFRRWHRASKDSGSLLVHKATHHFDLVNWYLDDEPEEVFAHGRLGFYGPTRQERGERCLDCEYKDSCFFYLDLKADDEIRELYLNAESEDGYIRDRCVFSDEIDIYDSMVLSVCYQKGALMSYSLNAFMPYEGFRIAFNGTMGRLEATIFEDGPWPTLPEETLHLTPISGEPKVIKCDRIEGGHAGGDARLLEDIFRPQEADP